MDEELVKHIFKIVQHFFYKLASYIRPFLVLDGSPGLCGSSVERVCGHVAGQSAGGPRRQTLQRSRSRRRTDVQIRR